MNYVVMVVLVCMLSGCAQMMPGLFQAIDDVATDDAVNVSISKEAVQSKSDVKVSVDLINGPKQ